MFGARGPRGALCFLLVLATAEDDEQDDDRDCGDGPFERCGFFYDVIPWWHLISPLFVLLVIVPLLVYSTKQRGRMSGWTQAAERFGVAAWPASARDVGAARFCRAGRPDACGGDFRKHQKLDKVVRFGVTEDRLCARVECCAAYSQMQPLAIPWRDVEDRGARSACWLALGQLAVAETMVLTFDRSLHEALVARAAEAAATTTGGARVVPLEVETRRRLLDDSEVAAGDT